jgi:hypothetical protein
VRESGKSAAYRHGWKECGPLRPQIGSEPDARRRALNDASFSLISMTELQLTAAQRELLLELPTRFEISKIDRIWIFTANVSKLRETGLFAISLLPAAEQETSHRSLYTFRYRVETNEGKLQRLAEIAEEGRAPPERIDRVIAGVLARSGDEAGEPMLVAIEGEEAAWQALIVSLGLAA